MLVVRICGLEGRYCGCYMCNDSCLRPGIAFGLYFRTKRIEFGNQDTRGTG